MTQGKLPLTTALRTDLAKIAALVNERHGIVIPPDDPAWAIVRAVDIAIKRGSLAGISRRRWSRALTRTSPAISRRSSRRTCTTP